MGQSRIRERKVATIDDCPTHRWLSSCVRFPTQIFTFGNAEGFPLLLQSMINGIMPLTLFPVHHSSQSKLRRNQCGRRATAAKSVSC
jgi:hypothetical protein